MFFFLYLGHRSFPLFSWAAAAMTTEVGPLDSLPSGVKLLLRHLHALIPEKLSDINYPTWKITVLTALEANYLLKYVDGSTEQPPAVITATDKSEKPIRPMPPGKSWMARSDHV